MWNLCIMEFGIVLWLALIKRSGRKQCWDFLGLGFQRSEHVCFCYFGASLQWKEVHSTLLKRGARRQVLEKTSHGSGDQRKKMKDSNIYMSLAATITRERPSQSTLLRCQTYDWGHLTSSSPTSLLHPRIMWSREKLFPSRHTWIPELHICEQRNGYGKLLNLGIICYTAICGWQKYCDKTLQ